MDSIQKNLKSIKKEVGDKVLVVAVSKTKSIDCIKKAYETGHRDFGENKIQEMTSKFNVLPEDINWHMIGHIQTNKVKYLAPYVSLIHSLDSLKLAKEINKQAIKNNRIIECLIQYRISNEETKFGLNENEVIDIIKSQDNFRGLRITGLMGMASFVDDQNVIEEEFKKLKTLFDKIKLSNKKFKIISMGMTLDYNLAIKNGSNMIRIGSKIFGERHV
ncbi:MAG: YggS family pyridoxal phosphate-dependent enzyme [Flavobacteriales bacterium]|nr:MAG: YggS family pyridoxal phosphate-dependent enzyme [Flavobacteriales bacterium]